MPECCSDRRTLSAQRRTPLDDGVAGKSADPAAQPRRRPARRLRRRAAARARSAAPTAHRAGQEQNPDHRLPAVGGQRCQQRHQIDARLRVVTTSNAGSPAAVIAAIARPPWPALSRPHRHPSAASRAANSTASRVLPTPADPVTKRTMPGADPCAQDLRSRNSSRRPVNCTTSWSARNNAAGLPPPSAPRFGLPDADRECSFVRVLACWRPPALDLCCSCVGRSSPGKPPRLHPGPGPVTQARAPACGCQRRPFSPRCRRPPENRLPPATRWPARHSVTPRPGRE